MGKGLRIFSITSNAQRVEDKVVGGQAPALILIRKEALFHGECRSQLERASSNILVYCYTRGQTPDLPGNS